VYSQWQLKGAVRLSKLLIFEECELDLGRYELRRAGRTVKLEKQPLEILVLLLERPGELFTREEIKNRLWSKDVFLDAEQGINNGIRKIRVALGDDFENPRYIETVVGRGYRFKAQIRNLAGPNAIIGRNRIQLATENEHDGSHSMTVSDGMPPITHESAVQSPNSLKQEPSPVPLRRWWRSLRRRIALGIAFLVCVAGAFLMIPSNARERLFGTVLFRDPIQSIAVLPLANFSGDPNEEYFVDGMTDELITDLAQFGSLRVVSRTSIMQYKDNPKPLRQIARELQVDAVVEGSVVRSGDQVRITAQLIDARDDRHLWAQSYDRKLGAILQLQGEVAADIAQKVSSNLSSAHAQPRSRAVRSLNLAAFDDYLKGRYYSQRLTNADLIKGIGYLERSIQQDPNYAPAYTDLAIAYAGLGGWFGWSPPGKTYPKAKAAALRALALDPDLAEAHAVLGWLDGASEWNWNAAEKELQRGVELNPNSSFAHLQYALYLVTTGQRAIAELEIKRTLELDPLSPFNRSTAAYVFTCMRQYDRGIQEARRAIELDPTFADAHINLAEALGTKGLYQEGFSEWLQYLRLSGDAKLAQQLEVAAKALSSSEDPGRKFGHIVLRYFKDKSRTRYVAPLFIAGAYLDLGDKDHALEWLDKAYRERSSVLFSIKVDPTWDPLRSDPRFQDLLRRMNFPHDAAKRE
jgi:TolB-like protein/DNA-binding winged helix-turn-helix (wHTH) protein